MGGGERGKKIRRLAAVAIVGQLAWLAFVVFGGLFEPGYSEVRDAVSFLGARNAADPWIFNTVVAISGVSFIALAVALALDAPRGLRGKLGPLLIGIAGIAQIVAGFPFPADCRETIDAGCHAREAAGQVSWRHVAHGWAYFLGAISLLLSVFAMAWRFQGDPHWKRADRLALAGGICAIAIVGGLFLAIDNAPEGHYGMAQRFALVGAGAWVGALTLGLLDLYGRRRFLGATAVLRQRAEDDVPEG
jgi:hypothetical protein